MASKNDYYETLGIAKGANEDEIKKAYRKMAKKYHPDANPNDKTAEAKFKEVSEAYEVLSDPQKRSAYDQYGHAAFDGSGAGGYNYSGDFMNMDDIFDMFDMFGGGGGRSKNRPRRGADVQTNINISFEEAYFGTVKEITMPVTEDCDTCKGTGSKPGTVAESCKNCGGTGQERVTQQTLFGTMSSARTCKVCNGSGKIIKEPCPKCAGKGKVRRSRTFEVKIPKGIDSGMSIPIRGRGEPGINGGETGDLLVTVYVQPHEHFIRKSNNIHLEVPITFVQATLGAEIVIPTMDGTEKYTVKAGTQTGTTVHIKGKGFPSVRNNRISGDLVVVLKVMVPKDLTDRQKELLKEFAQESGEEFDDSKKGFFSKIKDKFDA